MKKKQEKLKKYLNRYHKEFLEKIKENQKLIENNSEEFKKIFKEDIKKFSHPIFGFDILKMNSFISPPDGKSLSEEIKNRYGKKAELLVRKLLKIK